MEVSVIVNGTGRSADVEPRTLLVHYLRDDLGLTGTNIGCDTSSCGACTVLVDGRSAKSCTLLAAQVDGAEVTTIEGLATADGLHPMQQAFHECHALQCGYCTPGMVMAAVSLVDEYDDLDAAGVRVGLEGNLCRCTGYQNIVRAVLAASE
ncbi:MAG TPA: (2Fe-2S)-binding protein [Acidimicrobiia bacterium]|jgi:aerobic-type carbon monoxide dehydrogenase small subunit (CoxS/CutS family)|nr:(2Fe-2S)-binding protein [Actinomycetota bacterium]MEE2631489.1 (2Fe-2S)-binding protein [Actinomycetota bacterium]HIE66985.1 (2Fe-2S)-binding protein [Acidimicrobiia bacterium]HIL47679.1 (2Fe-2S)-binding protein [Acidimicrobiia bacterium]